MQLGVVLLRHLHGLGGDYAEQVHQDHHRVQIQAAQHREEPADQAENDGAGAPRAPVGHVRELGAGRGTNPPGAAGERTQAPHRDAVRLPGSGRRPKTTRRGLLLKKTPWNVDLRLFLIVLQRKGLQSCRRSFSLL